MKDDLPASGEWWKVEDGTTLPKMPMVPDLGQDSETRSSRLIKTGDKRLSFPELLGLPSRACAANSYATIKADKFRARNHWKVLYQKCRNV